MKSPSNPPETHIIDFEKELHIRQISQCLRQEAKPDYVRALSQVLAVKYQSDSQPEPLDLQPA